MSVKVQGLILLIQLMLIAGLFIYKDNDDNQLISEDKFLTIDSNKISVIYINDNNANKITLRKIEGQWILPEYHQLSVNRGLLDDLIEKLSGAKPGWPVAQTESAAKRFNVADNQFLRHIQFESEGKAVADIYLGDSPGLRKIYLRKKDEIEIYEIELALHMAPSTGVEWFDKSILKLHGDITEIRVGDILLKKELESWNMAGLEESETLNQKRIDSILTNLKYPQVLGVAAKSLLSKIDNNKADVHYDIKVNDRAVSFDFFKTSEGVVVKSSESDLYFIAAGFVADNLLSISRGDLIKH